MVLEPEILETNWEEQPIKNDGRFKSGAEWRGNAKGRPKGQTMKEFAREFLSNMTPEDKKAWLARLPEEIVWRMAEGNPKQDTDITSGGASLAPLSIEERAKLKMLMQ